VIYWIIILIIIGIISIIKVDKPIAKIYMFILVVGLILSGSAMVFWTLEPKYDAVCTIRWWIMGLGMIIFSGGVFCRIYQLKKIHQLIKKGLYKASQKFDHIKLLFIAMSVVILVELVYVYTNIFHLR